MKKHNILSMVVEIKGFWQGGYRALTLDQNSKGMRIYQESQEHFNSNKTDFLRRVIGTYETWV